MNNAAALAQPCIVGQHYMVTVKPEDGSPWYRKCTRCSATRAKGESHIVEPVIPGQRGHLEAVR